MIIPPFLKFAGLNESQKGWLYSNVYYLKELRDIALFLSHNIKDESREAAISLVEKNVSSEGVAWTSRRVYECINALINFDILDKDWKLTNDYFKYSRPNTDLSEYDILVFEDIYFTYDKFVDYHSLFLQFGNSINEIRLNKGKALKELLIKESEVLFVTSDNNKYTNKFLYLKNETVYLIPENYSPLMVFWDVYIKWGRSLGLLEKISLVSLPYAIASKLVHKKNMKDVQNGALVYFIRNNIDVSLSEFIEENFKSKYIFIPELVVLLCIHKRTSIDFAKSVIVSYVKLNRSNVSVERTSDIFVKGFEKYLYPILNNSFVSHLLLR